MSADSDLLAATLAETIALHERVKQSDPRPIVETAVAIVEAPAPR